MIRGPWQIEPDEWIIVVEHLSKCSKHGNMANLLCLMCRSHFCELCYCSILFYCNLLYIFLVINYILYNSFLSCLKEQTFTRSFMFFLPCF